jgi:hypothetical protein
VGGGGGEASTGCGKKKEMDGSEEKSKGWSVRLNRISNPLREQLVVII